MTRDAHLQMKNKVKQNCWHKTVNLTKEIKAFSNALAFKYQISQFLDLEASKIWRTKSAKFK